MTDPSLVRAARRAWSGLESLHVIGYFAEETRDQYVALGLHPRLSYFPARAAAMGPVGPGISEATFYVFAPWLHRAALPSAWDVTTPERLVQARRDGTAEALGRILGQPDVSEALAIVRQVTEGLTAPGRPLYAAHAGLDWPGDELLALWHAATLVREHRGDGHVAVLTASGVGPVEATVLDGLWSGRTTFLHRTRGWSEDELAAGTASLVRRGWVEGDALTDKGRHAREHVEQRTDAAGLVGWEHVGLEQTERLAVLLAPLRQRVVGSGVLPEEIARALERVGNS
jgi:hypothetical protein